MQNKIKELKKKFETVYEGSPWYGDSIKSLLKKISAKTALTKSNKNSHSIAELVSHMISWREFLLKRLQGDKEFDVDQENSFQWSRIDSNEKTAWKSLLKELDKNQRKILGKLEKLDDDFLTTPVSKRKYKMNYLIEGVIQHDLYHAGQILLLAKLINI